MFYWLLMLLVAALTAALSGCGVIHFSEPYLRARWESMSFFVTWFTRMRVSVLAGVRSISKIRLSQHR
jgi:hypothetical protein